ncbi:MAG: hypothetical protein DYG94_05925 [Leptolyngbya sp. PLA3]|nr:MAG: hypothetical protein EDM82_03645 [Cyanobacteria bacterium CYA]MCE7968267.1 hypothetical protein [Leptolyngbya sp. PL-A3]
MNARKGLMIGLVIVCLGLAVLTYFALSPKKATESSEYEKMKARSDEMTQKAQEAAPKQPQIPEEDFTPPTGKGPQRVGG